MKIVFAKTILFLCLVTIFLPFIAFAQPSVGTRAYLPLTTVPGAFEQGKAVDPNELVGNIYQISIGIGAMLAVIMIVWGGMRYTLSEAISGKEEAKSHIRNAVIGLVLLLSSFLLLKTINNNLTTINLRDFGDPSMTFDPGAFTPAKTAGWYWYWKQTADTFGPNVWFAIFNSGRFENVDTCRADYESKKANYDGDTRDGYVFTVYKECEKFGTTPDTSSAGTWWFDYMASSLRRYFSGGYQTEGLCKLARTQAFETKGIINNLISLGGLLSNIAEPSRAPTGCYLQTQPYCYTKTLVGQTRISVQEVGSVTENACNYKLAQQSGNNILNLTFGESSGLRTYNYDLLSGPLYYSYCHACQTSDFTEYIRDATEWCFKKEGTIFPEPVCKDPKGNIFTTFALCEATKVTVYGVALFGCGPKL